MVPKPSETTNLLVPVCMSASHVAYSSLRMEPQYMIIGQAAGVAAALALRGKTSVANISTHELTRRLVSQGAVMEYRPPATGPAFFHQLWQKYMPEQIHRMQLP
jgi:hypothetical protein